MIPAKSVLGLVVLLPLLAARASADVLVVRQVGTAFDPRELVVEVGDTVRWIWTSGTHDVTEGTDGIIDGDEAFHRNLNGGQPVFEHTFDQAFIDAWPRPGMRYDYFCTPHFGVGMTAAVTVSDGAGRIYCSCDGEGAFPTCGNFSYWGEGCRNSTFYGGILREHGSASLGADDLVFDATKLVPNQPGLLFAGVNPIAGGAGAPYGDGLRCAGGSVRRLGVRTPDVSGAASWGPGLGAFGGFAPGETRYFQVWYRDPVGGACGSGFNLTNGIRLTYAP